MGAPRKIGIVGAGTMGSGIAQKTAQSGLPVVLMDIKEEYVEAGLGRIRKMLEQGVARKVFRPGEPDKVLGRIEGTTDPARLSDCDLVVEAVFEDLDVKRKLFFTLEEHVRPDTVLATNTSSFTVEDVAKGAKNPERIVGLHYFFHPAKNALLEVIPGPHTSAEALSAAWAFSESTGKTGIQSKDVSGFIVNRFFVPWLNENVRMLEEGVADILTIEETNKKLLGIGMGPFQVMNVTGVPIAQHASEGLASHFGPFYSPCELLKKQVASRQDWDLSGEASNKGIETVEKRILGVILLVTATLVSEGIATVEDIDIGAKVGLRWRLGPFALANKQGIEKVVAAAAATAQKYDLPLPGIVSERMKKPEPFKISAVTMTVEDKIARITMNRPDALNAIDPGTVDSLTQVFKAAEADPAVEAIVIEGRGKAFVAGADIKFFINGIDNDDVDGIVAFTRLGQELCLRIDKCPKPVVARVGGLALGGGAELALSCDAIVADEKAALGFPETGIGIYPGFGGTQRAVKRCGLAVGRYLVLTGDVLPAAKAAALGLVDRVTPNGTSMEAVKELLSKGLVKAGEGAGDLAAPNPQETAKYEALFTDENTQRLLDGSFSPVDELGEKVKAKISTKAPIALKIASELMSKAAELPIDEGVEAELSHLPEVFSSKDGRAGLVSVLERTKPVFKGI